MKSVNRLLMIVFFLCSAVAFAEVAGEDESNKEQVYGTKPPFASDESIVFYSRKEGMIGFMRPRWFSGIIAREDSVSDNLHMIELYRLNSNDAEKVGVDDQLCANGAKLVLGPLDHPLWKVGKAASYTNRYGNVCELQVFATSKIADIKEYRFAVASIHGTNHLFLAKFRREAKDAEIKEYRAFISGLYADGTSAKTEGKKPARAPASLPTPSQNAK